MKPREKIINRRKEKGLTSKRGIRAYRHYSRRLQSH